MIAERAFVAQRLGRVNVAFEDEAALGKMFSSPGQLSEPNRSKQLEESLNQLVSPPSLHRLRLIIR